MFLRQKEKKKSSEVSVFLILPSAFTAMVENLFRNSYRSSSFACWATRKGVAGEICFPLFSHMRKLTTHPHHSAV